MSILDDLAAETVRKGPACKVGAILDSMSNEDRGDLVTALTSTYASTSLSHVLERRGIEINPLAINRHRRGECKCRSRTS